MQGILGQDLDCITLNPNIVFCSDGGNCVLRVFDSSGNAHIYPYTIGGLLDLTNFYLGGNLVLSAGQSGVYATALNQALEAVTANWLGGAPPTACAPSAGAVPAEIVNRSSITEPKTKQTVSFHLAPNPTSTEFTFDLNGLAEATMVSMDIYTPFGQLKLHKDFGKIDNVSQRIDVGSIDSGLYIVSVKAGGQRFEQKLVIL